VFHQEGAWAEVVSGFEYEKAIRNGVPGNKILFNGPDKTIAELKQAIENESTIHIDHFEQREGPSFYGDFYQCFEKVYFSYEMGMRKPDAEIYTTLINRHELSPKRTLFVDDKKDNTDAAKALGLHVWNLQVGKEDVIELLDKKII
jgi:FMN phosphatase YigB (HAD superfamily)